MAEDIQCTWPELFTTRVARIHLYGEVTYITVLEHMQLCLYTRLIYSEVSKHTHDRFFNGETPARAKHNVQQVDVLTKQC